MSVLYVSSSSSPSGGIEKVLGEPVYKAHEVHKRLQDLKALVVDPREAKAQEVVQRMRRAERGFLLPIFSEHASPPLHGSDGVLGSDSRVLMHAIHERLQGLPHYAMHNPDMKILMFLLTRPKLSLVPHADSTHWQFYTYPPAAQFLEERDDVLWRLSHLTQAGFLERSEVVDKLLCCPSCSAAHLQFRELCPQCKSFDVRTEMFLHCFTCGLVSPQSAFTKMDRLICPKCNTQLRHIGSDYDRSLETGTCGQCGQSYIDADVQVRCMLCQESFPPERTRKRDVDVLALSDYGREHITLLSTVEDTLKAFEDINYTSPDYFYTMLDWMIAMQRRYEDAFFTLLGINIYVKEKTATLQEDIYALATQVRRLLRQTDILTRITRLQDTSLWILLSKTDDKGFAVVKKKLEESLGTLKFGIVAYHSSHTTVQERDGKSLVVELSSGFHK